ncbi:MAG TPA: MaoC family dehydratase N-terminal domain-containing protein [Ramlibacter sp.]|nr:MaoC family dehydratase N-terminal domain-containing protein [Ramlibacter sp.]
MIDKSFIGTDLGRRTLVIEEGAVRFYAKAIGETDPIYSDVDAARAAGLRSLRVPPTYLSCLETQAFPSRDVLKLVGMELKRILHAEQAYTYHAPVCAGESLTFESRIADIYEKKGGALEFLIKETRVTNQDGVHVADLRSTVVQRQLGKAS